jgi:hypothetical protein
VKPEAAKAKPAANQTKPSEAKDRASLADLEQAGGASLEKVRDILFGVQIRDFDKRFARLEERLAKEILDIKEDVRKRLAALETYMKKEVDSMDDRLRAEQEARSDRDKDLSGELKEQAKAFEKRFSGLDETLTRNQKDLRQQILDLHKTLTDEILQKSGEVLAALDRESRELRTDKADRAALASLFTEVAMRLNNEFKLPVPEKNVG